MNRRTVHALVLCAAAILSTGLALAAPDVRLRDDNALWDEEKMALNLKDADVRQVLTLVFQIAEEPVMIDPCVRGSVSLKFENVGLRDALTSIARMGDFTVRPRREGYFVGCVNRAADRTADGQIIVFRLTNLGDGSVVAQPKLLVAYDSLAEIEIGSLAAPDLDDVGEFFAGGATARALQGLPGARRGRDHAGSPARRDGTGRAGHVGIAGRIADGRPDVRCRTAPRHRGESRRHP